MKKYVVNWVSVHDERYVSFLGIEARFSSREKRLNSSEEVMKTLNTKLSFLQSKSPKNKPVTKKSASQNFDDGYNQFLLRQAGRVRYVTPVHLTIQTIYGKL